MLKSIKFKISMMMMLLLIFPLVIVGYISYSKSEALEYAVIQKDDLESLVPKFGKIFGEYETILNDVSQLPELQYDTYQFSKDKPDKTYANMPLVNDPVKTEFYEGFLMDIQNKYSFLLNAYLATEDDQFYLSNLPPEEVDLSNEMMTERDWYIQAIENEGEVIWTEPYMDTGSGKSTITLAKTVTDNNGKVIGVAGLDFDMHELAVILRHNTLEAIIITGVIALILGSALVFVFVTRFSKNLLTIRDNLNDISEGKLNNKEVKVKSKDEIQELATALNRMQNSLKSMIIEVEQASEQVAVQSKGLTKTADEINTGAAQIASTMEELATGSETQANSASEVSSTMQKFNDEINKTNENAAHIQASTKDVIAITKEGNESMQVSKQQMENIEEIMEDAVRKVQGLDAQTKEISNLISVIKDIADQTNLLALNAAIEAARAGEQGQGFAVVADEVRKLAEQVSGSIVNITEIVTGIQQDSDEMVKSLQTGYNAVHSGSEQINITGEKFDAIHNAISNMVDEMIAVSDRLTQITNNSNDVNNAVENIAAVSEESAAGIEETYASSQQSSESMEEVVASSKQLEELSESLKKSIAHFKIN